MIDDPTSWSSTKAIIINAGEGVGRYKAFTSLIIDETMSHLALYLLHKNSPSPKVEMKFKSHLVEIPSHSTYSPKHF